MQQEITLFSHKTMFNANLGLWRVLREIVWLAHYIWLLYTARAL